MVYGFAACAPAPAPATGKAKACGCCCCGVVAAGGGDPGVGDDGDDDMAGLTTPRTTEAAEDSGTRSSEGTREEECWTVGGDLGGGWLGGIKQTRTNSLKNAVLQC